MSAMLNTTPSQLELGVQAVARELDDLERLLDALQREVLRLGVSSAWSAATSALTVSRPSAGGQSIRMTS